MHDAQHVYIYDKIIHIHPFWYILYDKIIRVNISLFLQNIKW